ncbi:MurR/RpiR family transcriptional regulator [Loigolactobacillus backii]|uniref:MurR/RpiR family transcriptional regulator n=1 Tax=Lactobacillaceae TaxID=33958 RepID=UPI0007F0D296|nr:MULTISPECIES: MurR/RpiR family transcriptional regulator [Lactobacillaceae]ANK66169.1 RpiR family transcriptional regulator [Loigolactobacillus backii]ANZ62610.1 RpiR family transcriptional regulator [Secundilactobacillus paracollinoides]ANZ65543.1 RpiR family transcriptional regulator [Secundilactobacillus paracollinoides]PIO80168.1 MurR/RpiR family transcriptional regulator [Loigolactobacillus backii]
MNFFEIVSAHLSSLTKSEQSLFDYVIKNMDHIKTQSIREVAAETFVSTATFLRFVKKIGFSGFSEFTTVIKFTVLNNKDEEKPSPFTVSQTDYREEYLKNITESVRVISAGKLHQITSKLAEHPRLFFFSKGVDKYATEYIHYLYTMAGFEVEYPRDHDFRAVACHQVKKDDVVFFLTYDGQDAEYLQMINEFVENGEKPLIISVTEPDNNTIQNLSDLNLYIFADDVSVYNTEISSRISTIAVMELILYQYIEDYGGRDFNFVKLSGKN